LYGVENYPDHTGEKILDNVIEAPILAASNVVDSFSLLPGARDAQP
jgi:hypothetical protein